MATSEGNRRLEAVRWKEAVAVQETLHSQLASVELRNKELEVAAARLFQELGEMRTGSSSSLEARLSKGEQMLSSINATLTDLEKARDEEVAKLQESLATCQAETRRLRFEQQAERRETAELLAELAAEAPDDDGSAARRSETPTGAPGGPTSAAAVAVPKAAQSLAPRRRWVSVLWVATRCRAAAAAA